MTSTLTKVFYVSVLFIDTCTLQIVCSGSALPVRNHNFVYCSHLLSDVPIIARQLCSLDLILAVCNAVLSPDQDCILRTRRCDSFKTGDELSEKDPSPLLPFRTIAVCLLNPYSCKHAISRARCNQIINPARVRDTTQRSLQPAIKLKHLSGWLSVCLFLHPSSWINRILWCVCVHRAPLTS